MRQGDDGSRDAERLPVSFDRQVVRIVRPEQHALTLRELVGPNESIHVREGADVSQESHHGDAEILLEPLSEVFGILTGGGNGYVVKRSADDRFLARFTEAVAITGEFPASDGGLDGALHDVHVAELGEQDDERMPRGLDPPDMAGVGAADERVPVVLLVVVADGGSAQIAEARDEVLGDGGAAFEVFEEHLLHGVLLGA